MSINDIISPPLLTPNLAPPGRSTRDHIKPSYLNNYMCNAVFLTDLTTFCFTSHISPVIYLFSVLSFTNQQVFNSISTICEPTSFA